MLLPGSKRKTGASSNMDEETGESSTGHEFQKSRSVTKVILNKFTVKMHFSIMHYLRSENLNLNINWKEISFL